MRNSVIGLVGAMALATASAFSPTLAADLKAPAYSPLVAAPVYSWTGFYLGANVGAGWGTNETSLNAGGLLNNILGNSQVGASAVPLGLTMPLPQTQMNGFLGGVQGGYNWQSGMFVLGLEGDFDWTGLKGNSNCILVLNCSVKVNWTADITGRLGVTVTDRTLVYLKGGVAWENVNVGVNQAATLGAGSLFGSNAGIGALSGSATTTKTGALIGVGTEYAFMQHWTAKIEYDYMNFGTSSVNVPIVASGAIGSNGRTIGVNAPVSINDSLHQVKAGVNYRF